MTRRPSFAPDDDTIVPAPSRSREATERLKAIAAETAREHGFDRQDAPHDTTPPRRRTGPKPGRPQGRLTMTGPKEVFADFQRLTAERGVTYWQQIEAWIAAENGGGR